jgi:hypothetical protein
MESIRAGLDRRSDSDPGSGGAEQSPMSLRAGHQRAVDRELDLYLSHARHLLNYALEAGIEVEPEIAQKIIAASHTTDRDNVWATQEAGDLISAITRLAAKLYPVTAETLRACREDAKRAIRRYRWLAVSLAVLIIPLSMISFIYTGISTTISADVKNANELAVALHTQLDASEPKKPAPPGAVTELQQFAAATRAIYSRTKQLAWFVPERLLEVYSVSTPRSKLELDPNLGNSTFDVQSETNRLTGEYQLVRAYATSAQDSMSVIWGAVGSCILPVLYALLGACAYVLRTFTQQVKTRTFELSVATGARLIIAAIGGCVVGLFNIFAIGQGATLPPLGLAFLIGYAADIFFSFLEGLTQTFGRGKSVHLDSTSMH